MIPVLWEIIFLDAFSIQFFKGKGLWRSSGPNPRSQIQSSVKLFYFFFLISVLSLTWMSWKRVKWLPWLRILRIHLYQRSLPKLDLPYANWNLSGSHWGKTSIRFRTWSWFHCKWIRSIKIREDHWLLTRRWLMGHSKTHARRQWQLILISLPTYGLCYIHPSTKLSSQAVVKVKASAGLIL